MAHRDRLAFDVALGPELEAGIAEQRAEVDAIAAGPWPPDFDDTIAALERSGGRLYLARRLLEDAAATRSTPAVRALQAEMLPRLAAHDDAVGLDPRLFARIADLAARRDALGLDAEQAAVLDRYHRDVVRAGATLGEAEQARLRAINARLSVLSATFRRQPPGRDGGARRCGSTTRPSSTASRRRCAPPPPTATGSCCASRSRPRSPPSSTSHDRALRERLDRASVARCRRGGPHDNRAVVSEIAALRAERAGLLGFASHAEFALATQTAGSVAAVTALLAEVGAAAVAAARREVERHTAALHADGHDGPLEPWDFPYYAARERRDRHAVDEARVPEFLVLDRVVEDGLFAVAGELYGLTFTRRDDLPRPHPDARVWTVADGDGTDRGELYVDPYARHGKQRRGLAGRLRRAVTARRPAAAGAIVLNATRPADGAPALVTPLDARILFHEFGHALHMLLSDVPYPRVAGINVPDDVVEFPSKLHESLAVRPDVLARYARHHATGVPLRDADAAALSAYVRDTAASTRRRASPALLDQAWHGLAPGERVTRGRGRRLRGPCPRASRPGAARGRAALPLRLLPAHLRRSVRGHALLYLWSGRRSRRRHSGGSTSRAA